MLIQNIHRLRHYGFSGVPQFILFWKNTRYLNDDYHSHQLAQTAWWHCHQSWHSVATRATFSWEGWFLTSTGRLLAVRIGTVNAVSACGKCPQSQINRTAAARESGEPRAGCIFGSPIWVTGYFLMVTSGDAILFQAERMAGRNLVAHWVNMQSKLGSVQIWCGLSVRLGRSGFWW
jgi:hypothetical protein